MAWPVVAQSATKSAANDKPIVGNVETRSEVQFDRVSTLCLAARAPDHRGDPANRRRPTTTQQRAMSAMDIEEPVSPAARLAALEKLELSLVDGAAGDLGSVSAQLLLLYVVADRLDEARFVWRRSPEAARAASAPLRGAWTVGAALWERRDVPGDIEILETGAWDDATAPLAAEAAAAVRDRELLLFASSYGEVRLGKVAAALRLTDQQALEACRSRGWVFSATSATLKPKPPPEAAPTFDGFEQLQHLTAIVTQLSQN